MSEQDSAEGASQAVGGETARSGNKGDTSGSSSSSSSVCECGCVSAEQGAAVYNIQRAD